MLFKKISEFEFSLSHLLIWGAVGGGVVVLALVFHLMFISTTNRYGEETVKRFSSTHKVIGEKVVDKELGGIIGTRKVPGLFIYLLQDVAQPHKLRVIVAQSLGYSVGEVTIEGSALNAPVTFTGEGRFWGAIRRPEDRTPPETFYDREIIAWRLDGSEVRVSVTYYWINRGGDVGMYEFESLSATTEATFPLNSP